MGKRVPRRLSTSIINFCGLTEEMEGEKGKVSPIKIDHNSRYLTSTDFVADSVVNCNKSCYQS